MYLENYFCILATHIVEMVLKYVLICAIVVNQSTLLQISPVSYKEAKNTTKKFIDV